MALKKVTYIDETTVIEADNLNDIQDAIIALEKEDKLPTATPEDSGKVLQVVDGEWAVGVVPSSGGTSGETVTKFKVTESLDGTVTMENNLASGNTEKIVFTPDANGNPCSVSYNGVSTPIEWVMGE